MENELFFHCFRVRHRIALEPGHWHAVVKAKNSEGWSQFSNQEDLLVNGIYTRNLDASEAF